MMNQRTETFTEHTELSELLISMEIDDEHKRASLDLQSYLDY